ncbi:hypothetical protein [Hoeflea ulvae]|uniref:DUF4410 domain-containing protein n=1 Tax=Hoeflea ulvae TaxID=2983764 RepID=A0ABT3YFV7_9HYPH|nr:hypothetical protein [Hoeflea ulvae]MCY0094775.1 hypothetical protein [Hoeflea ulvae]
MGPGTHFAPSLVRLLVLLGLTVLLGACAGRPKPLEPLRPYTVGAVHVTAQAVSDVAFASRLQQRLEATAGHVGTGDGQTTTLRVAVLDTGAGMGLLHFFDSSLRSARIELVLTDTDTGQVLRTQTLQSTSVHSNGLRAETALVNRMVNDIRGQLGLSAYPPHPVSGPERAMVAPQARLDDFPDLDLVSADPLLNGTVTPTSAGLDSGTDDEAYPDISRPLLTAEPRPQEPETDNTMQAITDIVPPLRYEAAPADGVPGVLPQAGDEDEPCVITLETECGDPGNR